MLAPLESIAAYLDSGKDGELHIYEMKSDFLGNSVCITRGTSDRRVCAGAARNYHHLTEQRRLVSETF